MTSALSRPADRVVLNFTVQKILEKRPRKFPSQLDSTMLNVSKISSFTEAKEYINDYNVGLFISHNPVVRNLSFSLYSLSNLDSTKKTFEEYRSAKIDLAHKIYSGVKNSITDSLIFSPSIFLFIKYDIAITSLDTELDTIVRSCLLNSLALLLNFQAKTFSIEKIKSFNNYGQFTLYLLELPLTNNDTSVPSDPSPDNATPQQQRSAVGETVSDVASYSVLVADYEKTQQNLKRDFAVKLLPALKEEMRTRPHKTYEEKKLLVKWVNDELRKFGFVFKFPKSDKPSAFTTDAGNNPMEGRFRLVSEGEDKKRETFSTPNLNDLLENLELVTAPARRESLREWRDNVDVQRGRAR